MAIGTFVFNPNKTVEFKSINSGSENKPIKVDEQSAKKRLSAPRDFSNKDENIRSLLK